MDWEIELIFAKASRFTSLFLAAGLSWTVCGLETAGATEFPIPERGSVIGAVDHTYAQASDTLLDIARRHNLGYQEIKLANPGVDPWLPGAGRLIVLPTHYVLPDAPRRGLVLNVAEMRLYYYPRPRRGQPATVITHPVSIGRYDWETPLGRTRVVTKVKDPDWYPPKSIRAEHEANGDPLPRMVPAGPDNPLGRHALLLGIKGYLIHGTNKPFGIGMRVSHGCIRMYPEDIEALYGEIPVGTPVHIVDQPVKIGDGGDGEIFVEVHPRGAEMDLERDVYVGLDEVQPRLAELAEKSPGGLDSTLAMVALSEVSGMPVEVSEPPAPTFHATGGSDWQGSSYQRGQAERGSTHIIIRQTDRPEWKTRLRLTN